MPRRGKSFLRLVEMSNTRWRQLSMQMSWYYRLDGGRPVPEEIRAVFANRAPSIEMWRSLAKEVSAERRRLRAEAAKVASERRAERRRAYMRKYMRVRRGVATATDL
jgi:hypothetical protein